MGTLLGNIEGRGGSFTRDFKGKVSYQGMCRRRLWKLATLSLRATVADPGGVSFSGTF
jgi:hypothetical protein